MAEADTNLHEAAQEPDAKRTMSKTPLAEVVADKGYHSNATLREHNTHTMRTYISEPDRGRRDWAGKADEQRAVYANRRRIRGQRGRRLMRKRGELIERSFAHVYDTGGMRRTHIRHQDNILKRLLIHTGAFNLSLILRKTAGVGTPRELHDLVNALIDRLRAFIRVIWSPSCADLQPTPIDQLKNLAIHEPAWPQEAA